MSVIQVRTLGSESWETITKEAKPDRSIGQRELIQEFRSSNPEDEFRFYEADSEGGNNV